MVMAKMPNYMITVCSMYGQYFHLCVSETSIISHHSHTKNSLISLNVIEKMEPLWLWPSISMINSICVVELV
jgi:hypothetical protein